jgi:hypothetical protein
MKILLYVAGCLVIVFSLLQTFGAHVITSSGFVIGAMCICAAAVIGAIERAGKK